MAPLADPEGRAEVDEDLDAVLPGVTPGVILAEAGVVGVAPDGAVTLVAGAPADDEPLPAEVAAGAPAGSGVQEPCAAAEPAIVNWALLACAPVLSATTKPQRVLGTRLGVQVKELPV